MEEARYDELKKYMFDRLSKIVNDRYISSIIFLENKNVKYIVYYEGYGGTHTHIIYNNKAYSIYNYEIQEGQLIIKYSNEYDVPEDIITIIKILPESIIVNAGLLDLKLYYLLKSRYEIKFVKSWYYFFIFFEFSVKSVFIFVIRNILFSVIKGGLN